ncbi:hypothetical protein B0H19DRAFT_1253576 [Mycena capillaripes]|nr:hypothetical protein B0H19DRAFT_1253576 [Mycena capillaripes]
MTELMTQANLTVFDMTDTDRMINGLIFAAFNSDCNECIKAAFNVASSLIPGLNDTCGANNGAQLGSWDWVI